MKVRRDTHAPYRQLLAARLDRPLTRIEVRKLAAHLKDCVPCQGVEREYREQRLLLRGLAEPIPPRDLWARTSTALDTEMSRWHFRYPPLGRAARRRARSAPPGALATAVMALAVVSALTVLQFAPAIQSEPSAQPGRPTPFAVPPQDLAFVGTSAADLAIYSTRVSRVCPTTAPDCYFDDNIVRTTVPFRSSVRPPNVALSPTGQQLALVGYDLSEDVIAVVQLPSDAGNPPAPNQPGPIATVDTPRGGEAPTAALANSPPPNAGPTDAPPASSDGPANSPASTEPAPADPAATDELIATDPGAATAPPATAVAGLTVLAILEEVHSAGAAPAWSADGMVLAFSAMPSDGSHGPDVYVWQAGEEQARPITDDHSSFFASWAGTHVVASRVTGSAEEAARLDVATVVIDPASLEEREVNGPSMWLPAVNSQGTQGVAWHGTLAWQDGLPVPQDGRLYMIDWSRVDPFAAGATPRATEPPTLPPPTEPPTPEPPTEPPSPEPPTEPPTPEPSTEPPTPEPAAETPVPSPVKGETRTPPGSPSPAEATARAEATAPLDETDSGDPTSQPDQNEPTEATATPEPEGTPESTPSPDPTVETPPEETAEAPPDPTTETPPDPTTETPPHPTAETQPDSTAGVPDVLKPIDLLPEHLTDWQVRWSTDGTVIGIWVADGPGSSWGQLVVRTLDPETGLPVRDIALLGPTFASRGFTLGLDRVAWVAPTDESPDGELRIRTWGSDGAGRLDLFDLEEVVPAF